MKIIIVIILNFGFECDSQLARLGPYIQIREHFQIEWSQPYIGSYFLVAIECCLIDRAFLNDQLE